MKGVVFPGGRRVEIVDFPDPSPGPGEVVLEIKASGMCGSDLKFYRAADGAASLGFNASAGPVIAGHEPCGMVVAVGEGVSPKQARPGMRVMQHHYRGCGVCSHCSTGWMQLCVEGVAEVYGITGHGAHARYMRCQRARWCRCRTSSVSRPEPLLPAARGRLGAPSIDWRSRLIRRSRFSGRAPVGLSATQLATAMGARVIALDPSPERLAQAATFGADLTINPTAEPDVVAVIREATHGLGAHCSLDASSSPTARAEAVRCVRTWGKACFVGEGGSVTFDVSSDLLRRQVTLIGSWTFSTVGQAECARFVADRKIAVDALFTHRWRLEDAGEAYALFDRQSSGKGVLHPEQG